jgi:hypothetical protein
MNTWLRLTLITITVGGGFTGAAVSLQVLLGPQGRQISNFFLIGAFFFLFAFVTASGLMFVHNPEMKLPMVVALALQVPWVSSPFLAYKFAAGFQVSVAILGGRLSGGLRLGSDFQINLFQRMPWGAGVNLFALAMLLLLLGTMQTPRRDTNSLNAGGMGQL